MFRSAPNTHVSTTAVFLKFKNVLLITNRYMIALIKYSKAIVCVHTTQRDRSMNTGHCKNIFSK